jgi:hypothetical protein
VLNKKVLLMKHFSDYLEGKKDDEMLDESSQ